MLNEHIVNQINHPTLSSDNTLHVIGVISNPIRYHSRYRLFRKWYEEMQNTPNVKVYVVEVAYGDRQFEVTEANNKMHLQLRSRQEIWTKESQINLGVKHLLPVDWKYLCWSDTDIHFCNPHWVQEALHQLQFFNIIQPWQDCLDLGPQGTVLQHFQSFCYVHRLGVPKQKHPSQPYKYAHSGYAYCCTRIFWEMIEKLIDFAILGSADHHQAFGLVGEERDTIHRKAHPNFHKLIYEWSKKAYRACHGRVGFVPGRIEHQFHGSKNNRGYRSRWNILIDHDFDPVNDTTYDEQGLIHLIGKPQLLQAIHEYHIKRNEDEITPW